MGFPFLGHRSRNVKTPTSQSADELCVRFAAGHPRHGAGQQHTHGDSHYCQAQGC